MSARIYNLLNTERDIDWLMEHIDQLIPFDEAAQRVNIRWTRHYIHKHIALGRIDKRNVIVLEDANLFAVTPQAYNKGKKYFILESELDLLIEWYDHKQDKKSKGLKCRWCARQGKTCIANPCINRRKHQERVESYERIRRFTGRSK